MHLPLSHAKWALPALVLLFSSCVAAIFVRVPRHVPFDESAFTGYGAPGTGTVAGQLIATWDGETHLGGGSGVTLLPVTVYTQEMVDRELGNGAPLTPADGRLKKYIRRTKADHEGRFEIQQVPAGDYFVVGIVEDNSPSSPDMEIHQWGCERIQVGKGQTVRIQVSHDPANPNSAIGNSNTWTGD